jgi:curved DNA-binding protein CbpA
MTNAADYYQILGVLHDAEQIVITAAYRALASMYHPDRWKGDKAEATRRMADINVAYGVIGDPVKRAAYDKDRGRSTSTFAQESESADQAFDQALSELEARWQTAVEVIPDLADIRKRLAKTAHRLAFSFVVVMLDGKKFSKREQIANEMERIFLETYFGNNPEIIEFARYLIEIGRREAIKRLNHYVEIMGNDIDPRLIISKIKQEHKDIFNGILNQKKLDNAKSRYHFDPTIENAVAVAEAANFICEINLGGFFSQDSYSIYERLGLDGPRGLQVLNSASPEDFRLWLKKEFLLKS